jgi:hypothetical protein
MPYDGQASIDPKALYGAQHFVVMLPKTMQFTPGPNTSFQSMDDPKQSDAVVEVVSKTTAGQPLNFKISGTGLLSEAKEEGGEANTGAAGGPEAATAGRDTRPGGGLGPPIDAPDPLEKYRWYILGGFGIMLAGGAVYVARRSRAIPVPDFGASETELPAPTRVGKTKSAGHSTMLLEALKEEIFQLEVEHKQGRISQQEYDKAKAALDQTLERAVRREAAKQA